jgi:hypothetical protein
MGKPVPTEEAANPEEFLTGSTFTIPVDVPSEINESGEVIKNKRIFVTYQYDEGTRTTLKKGKMYPVFILALLDEKGNPTGREVVLPKIEEDAVPEGYIEGESKRDFSTAEMILLVVKEINGIARIDEDLINRMPPKYQEAIIDAVMRDAFPSLKTARG